MATTPNDQDQYSFRKMSLSKITRIIKEARYHESFDETNPYIVNTVIFLNYISLAITICPDKNFALQNKITYTM